MKRRSSSSSATSSLELPPETATRTLIGFGEPPITLPLISSMALGVRSVIRGTMFKKKYH
jgi:hypothetical protein